MRFCRRSALSSDGWNLYRFMGIYYASPQNILASTMAIFFLTKREMIAQIFSFVLGLVTSSFPTYTAMFTFIAAVLYLLVIIALPNLYPGALLTETRNQITDTRIWLDDEVAARRSSRMHVITAQGLDHLERCAYNL